MLLQPQAAVRMGLRRKYIQQLTLCGRLLVRQAAAAGPLAAGAPPARQPAVPQLAQLQPCRPLAMSVAARAASTAAAEAPQGSKGGKPPKGAAAAAAATEDAYGAGAIQVGTGLSSGSSTALPPLTGALEKERCPVCN